MPSKNDITGDEIKTKHSHTYRNNYSGIFGEKPIGGNVAWKDIPIEKAEALAAFLIGRQCPPGGVYRSDYEEFMNRG
jgi:hypothetical protein